MKIQRDKIFHFAACAMTALLIAVVIVLLSKDLLCAVVAGLYSGIAIGVGKEYGDFKAVGNKWDWYDLLADIIGSVFGSVIGGLLIFVL